MISINGLLHREELGVLVQRWMQDQLRPNDAQRVAELVQFNAVFVRRALDAFSQSLLEQLFEGELQAQHAQRKHELKEALVEHPTYLNPRIEQLIADYRLRPEAYYGETPVRATIYRVREGEQLRYVASNRIKRVRRLAEKVARRIIDHVFTVIKNQADELADERALRLGVPRSTMLTDPNEMIVEFERAETHILELLREHLELPKMAEMVIDDVLGLKVIIEDEQRARLFRALEQLSGSELTAAANASDCREGACPPLASIVEVEAHSGVYNATNVVVAYRPDKERLLAEPLPETVLASMRLRGLGTEQCQQAYRRFVNEGEQTLHIELIMANYAEVLESELGRCMHEDRIVSQRGQQQYRGHLAQNIAYLIQYLFMFAQSGRGQLHELPFKLWHRYLPDYYDRVIRELYGLPTDDAE